MQEATAQFIVVTWKAQRPLIGVDLQILSIKYCLTKNKGNQSQFKEKYCVHKRPVNCPSKYTDSSSICLQIHHCTSKGLYKKGIHVYLKHAYSLHSIVSIKIDKKKFNDYAFTL